MRPLMGNSIWMRDVAHDYLKEDGFASLSEAGYMAIAEKRWPSPGLAKLKS